MKYARMILPLVLLVALIAGCSGDDGATGPVGPAGPSNILGYATVDADGTVLHFGGAGTDSVTTAHIADSGRYDVIFHGTYPGVMETNDVTGIATIASTANYHVASQSNIFVEAETKITSRVWTWTTRETPNVLEDRPFSVLIIQ